MRPIKFNLQPGATGRKFAGWRKVSEFVWLDTILIRLRTGRERIVWNMILRWREESRQMCCPCGWRIWIWYSSCINKAKGSPWEGAPPQAVGERAWNLAAADLFLSPSVSFADSAPFLALRATSPVSGKSVSQRKPFLLATTCQVPYIYLITWILVCTFWLAQKITYIRKYMC